MTNLETNFVEVLTREAVRFCSRVVWLFSALLVQMRTALLRAFINGFAKKEIAGPYESYNMPYIWQFNFLQV